MTCPSPSLLSMYADRELAAADMSRVENHLAQCAACRSQAFALDAEAAELRAVLQTAGNHAPAPRFERPINGLDILLLCGAGTGVAAFASAVWNTVGAAVPSGLHWLNPFGLGGFTDLVISLIVYLSFEGTTMLSSIVEISAGTALFAAIAWTLLVAWKPRAGTAMLTSILLLVIVMPSLGHAVEVRHADVTTIAAGETVDDTLIAIGESVAIDGTINGDLIAFARRVTVRGHVTGDVIGGAEIVNIEGTVDGNVFGFGRTVTLTDATIARNLYGFGRDVTIGSGASVRRNATTFANDADLSGRVGLDLLSFANELAMSGNVERNVDAYGAEVTIVPPGRVGGNVTAHVSSDDKFTVSAGATIVGQTRTDVRETAQAKRSPYLTTSFYVRQTLRLGAAFLTGALLLWILPGLQALSIRTGADAVKAGVVGLVTLVMLPVVALIACITIFGIPIGIAGFVVWLLGVYFAKIVLAQLIGRALFKSPAGYPHYAATLLSGLVVVLIAVNIPWIGWLANLGLTCLGLGLLALYAAGGRGREPAGAL